MTYQEYEKNGSRELAAMIERNSRKPMTVLQQGESHLSFNDEEYGYDYCENHCPLQEMYFDSITPPECSGDCRNWERHVSKGRRAVYGADLLVDEILQHGYQVLEISGINEPFQIDNSRRYADMCWETAYDCEKGICAKCKYYGSEKCPEDILNADCPKHGDAWAIERIAEVVNEVII